TDMDIKRSISGKGIRPHIVKQLFLCDHFVFIFRQIADQFIFQCFELDIYTVHSDTVKHTVDLDLTKLQYSGTAILVSFEYSLNFGEQYAERIRLLDVIV